LFCPAALPYFLHSFLLLLDGFEIGEARLLLGFSWRQFLLALLPGFSNHDVVDRTSGCEVLLSIGDGGGEGQVEHAVDASLLSIG